MRWSFYPGPDFALAAQSVKNLGSYTHHGRSLCSQLCCMLVACPLWSHCHHLLRLSGGGLSIVAVAAVL